MGVRLEVGVVLVALAALLYVAEWADPEDGRPARAPRPRRADVAWFGVYLLWAPPVARVVLAVAADVSRHGPLHGVIAGRPAVVRLALALFIAEAGAYWWHRALHAHPLLWRLHAVHHRPSELHWWSAFRFHPLDGALSHAVPVTAAAAVGVGPEVLSGYLAIVLVVTVFAHADLWLPGPLAVLVATPGFHRTHHETHGGGSNFAVVLPLFDHLFATATREGLPRGFGCPSGDQRSTTSPIVNDATLASPLTTQAATGPTSP